MRNTLKLKHPLRVNNKDFDELEYDFDEITCEDYALAAAYADARSLAASQQGKPNASIMEQNVSLHMYLGMFAIVSVNRGTFDIADLERVKGYDLVAVTQVGRNFIAGRSEEPLGENSSGRPSEVTPASTTQESGK